MDGFLLLLAVRSDYQTFLEPLGVPPLDQNRNWREVPAFPHFRGINIPESA